MAVGLTLDGEVLSDLADDDPRAVAVIKAGRVTQQSRSVKQAGRATLLSLLEAPIGRGFIRSCPFDDPLLP